MKTGVFARLMVLLCVFALTACASGSSSSGGGGGGSSLADIPAVGSPERFSGLTVSGPANMATDDATTSAILAASPGAAIDIGNNLEMVAGSRIIRDKTTLETIQKFEDGDVKKLSNDFLYTAAKNAKITDADKDLLKFYIGSDPASQDSLQITGKSTELVLASSAAGLEHAMFGFWSLTYSFTGASDPTFNKTGTYDVFYSGITDGIKDKAQTSPATATYTGTAVGYAGDYTRDTHHQLLAGTATLNLTNASGGGNSLLLNFPTYYDITFNNVSVAGGNFNKSVPADVQIAPGANRNAGSLNLDGVTEANLQGRFYGPATGANAAGEFRVANGMDQGIVGAFGVKK